MCHNYFGEYLQWSTQVDADLSLLLRPRGYDREMGPVGVEVVSSIHYLGAHGAEFRSGNGADPGPEL